jgi:hypothetical protein
MGYAEIVKPHAGQNVHEKKTPEARGGATGANSFPFGLASERYPTADKESTGKDRHKRAVSILSHCLALEDDAAWHDAAAVWIVRLTPPELMRITDTALRALAADTLTDEAKGRLLGGLDDEQRIAAADRMNEMSVMLGAGMPTAPLFSHMDQAVFWADLATQAELKAYALACFNRLRPTDQAAFLGYVQRGAAA